MTWANKWKSHLLGAHNPPSLTAAEPARVAETLAGVSHAVKSWDPTKGRVLALGCGDGTEIDHFKKHGFDATGVTFHDEEHAAASDYEIKKKMVNADGHDLPFEDGTFEYTYSKEYLEHLIAPFIGLHEIARVTRPGGRFCHFISIGLDKQREAYHFSAFPAYCWVDLFHKAGLVLESWRKVQIYGDAEQQIVLEGHTEGARDLATEVGRYDLRQMVNHGQGHDLVLMEGPRPK